MPFFRLVFLYKKVQTRMWGIVVLPLSGCLCEKGTAGMVGLHTLHAEAVVLHVTPLIAI